MNTLTRFTPFILLSLLISCSSYPPKNFAFPYVISSQDSVDTVVQSLAKQGFVVAETIEKGSGLYLVRRFKGIDSVRGLEIQEVQDFVDDNPVGISHHQILISSQPERARAVRKFIQAWKELRKDFGSPHYSSDGADCLIDALRSDTSIVVALERCRVDSINMIWQWHYEKYYYRRIVLKLVGTIISIDFSGGEHH